MTRCARKVKGELRPAFESRAQCLGGIRGALLGVALLMLIAPRLTLAQPGRGPASVVAVKAESKTVSAGQAFVGTVMPARQSTVGSAVAGRVIEFLVNEGDHVKKNQPLAEIRRDALQIMRAASAAQEQLASHELAELKNGARPEEIDQAKARMAAAHAMMSYRQSRYQRLKGLEKSRASSADEVSEAASLAEQGVQQYLEAKSNFELVESGPRKEKIAQAAAHHEAAVQEVARIDDQLRKHTVYAPFDGYISAEHTEVGQWISAADPVVEIVELDNVDVQTPVLESYVRHLSVGRAVSVVLDAFPDRIFEGQIVLINPKGDVRSRTFPVKVRLRNEMTEDGQPLLKPGMLAKLTLPVGKPEKAVLVPKDALVLGGPTPVIYLIDRAKKDAASDGAARVTPVQIGVVDRGWVQVKGDVKADDEIVVQGNERLMSGAPVKVLQQQANAANPTGSGL